MMTDDNNIKLYGLDESSKSSSIISKISSLRVCPDAEICAESEYEEHSWDGTSGCNEPGTTKLKKVKLLAELKKSASEENSSETELDDTRSISDISKLLNFTGLTENQSFCLNNSSLIDVLNASPQTKTKTVREKSRTSRKSLDFTHIAIKQTDPKGCTFRVESNELQGMNSFSKLPDYTEKENEFPTNRRKTRVWDRRNACVYCDKLVTNFSRHIIRNHSNETEVLEYIAINDSNPKIKKLKRRKITDQLRNRGNFKHNSVVAYEKGGVLLPKKRNNFENSPSNFVTCKNCLGTYKRSTFYRHFKRCGEKSSLVPGSHKNRVLKTNSISIIQNTSGASKELMETIIPRLRTDQIALIIQTDPLILAYGSRLLKKKKERRNRKAICSRMRDLATLLKISREEDKEIEALEDIIDPKKYETFIGAVKTMCGFNEETGFVNTVSIPARIRPAILGCIDILYTKMIMSNYYSTAYKETYKKKLDDFKILLEVNWQWEISSNAEKTRKRNNMMKENVLPLDDDIKKMVKKINHLEVKYYEKLKNDINVIDYEHLCEITISHIILLDRKRAGDIAEAELVFYLNRKTEDIPEKILETLTLQQKQCINNLEIFQIPGKRTRSVPILLTKTMRKSIDFIISCRPVLKIPETNPYLFARPMTNEPFDGGKCLNKIKKMCNLKRPEMLTSTGMRHHIATMSQIEASQNDKFTEYLAGFLGHDMAVHSKNYRLPLQVIQKGIVGSKLMEYENCEQKKTIKNASRVTATITSKDLESITDPVNNCTNDPTLEEPLQYKHIMELEENFLRYDKEQNIDTISPNIIENVLENDNINEEYMFCSEDEGINKKRKNSKKTTKNTKIDKGKKEKTLALRQDKQKLSESIVSENITSNKYRQAINEDIKKVKKLVLRKRKACNFKELNEELEEFINEETDAFDDVETDRSDYSIDQEKYQSNDLSSNNSDEETVVKKKRQKTIHRKWSNEEIKLVKKYFKENIDKKVNPGKAKCLDVLKKEPKLQKRSWMQVNSYVNNIYKKKK